MGPNTILDKSALEMLSIDESCWLDAFFSTNMTPTFLAESLADLEKVPKGGTSVRSALDIVSELAEKTPFANAYPNIYHQTLIAHDLIGQKVEMSNRVVLAGGQAKRAPDGRTGIYYEQFPEAEALGRWQKKEFTETEAIVAKFWRNALKNMDFEPFIAWAKNIIPTSKKLKSLQEIKDFLDEFVKGNDSRIYELACFILNIDGRLKEIVMRRQKIELKSFEEFAPYASFCLKVDLFFYLALHFSLIAKERPSNKIDISYLYYLPFCMVFVSNDKLHKKTVPLFVTKEQSFVDGNEFKKALGALDAYYSKLPDDVKLQGIMSFAQYPPTDFENLVTELWNKHMSPRWPEMKKESENKVRSPEKDKETVDKIVSDKEASIEINDKVTSKDADYVIIQHMVPPTKGKWNLFSQDIIDKNKSNTLGK